VSAHEILVDGHNVAHRLRLAGASEAVCEQVVTRVRGAAPRGATVFFDGHPGSGAFGGTEHRGVTLRFSGGAEADQGIVDHVRQAKRPRAITVVTDDLELARRVEQLGASSLRVRQFFADLPYFSAVREPPPDSKSAPGGFTAADFGLPEAVDSDRPSGNLDNHPDGGAPPRRRPRNLPKRPRI